METKHNDTTSIPTPSPEQPAEPTPRDINLEAAAAVAALGAMPVVLIVPINGNALDAQSNIVLPAGWRLAVGYVERPK
jgi:hypothetical protein